MGDGVHSANRHTNFGSDRNENPYLSTEKFSLSLGGAVRKNGNTPPQHQPTKRLRKSLLGEHELDLDPQRLEQISTFGRSIGSKGSIGSEPTRNARVIKSIPDKDWREENRRKKLKRSQFDSRLRADQENPNLDASEELTPKFGLTIIDRDSQGSKGENLHAPVAEPVPSTTDSNSTENRQGGPHASLQTADKEALAALLGHRPLADKAIISPSIASEEEAFRESYASAPRNCTLEEYEATPVEGYGAAILRGYLKNGQTLEDRIANTIPGKKRSEFVPERRPGLLGLGAKESGIGVDLGAWGKGAGGRNKNFGQPDASFYSPLARRNKKTGKILSEDGLDQTLQSQGKTSTNIRTYKGREETALALYGGDIGGSNSYEESNLLQRSDRSQRQKHYSEDRELQRRKDKYRGMDDRSDHGHRRRDNSSYDSEPRRRIKKDRYRDNDDEMGWQGRTKDNANNAVSVDRPRNRGRSSEIAKNDHRSGWR